MDEKYILAYFDTSTQAENTRQQLTTQDGIIDTHIDRIGPRFSLQPAITSVVSSMDEDTGALSQPAVHSVIEGRNILLTVAVRPDRHQETMRFVRASGGLI